MNYYTKYGDNMDDFYNVRYVYGNGPSDGYVVLCDSFESAAKVVQNICNQFIHEFYDSKDEISQQIMSAHERGDVQMVCDLWEKHTDGAEVLKMIGPWKVVTCDDEPEIINKHGDQPKLKLVK